MNALLVWAYCLSCNSSTLSVTKFDTMAECDAARAAIVQYATQPGFMSDRPAFENAHQPQCIPYAKPSGETP